MTNFSDRIASLSPEKRALLLQRLKEKVATEPRNAPPVKVNLKAEAQLDPEIMPDTSQAVVVQPSTIFLTGATGFLGAFLLDELLRKTRATFYCLVRANSQIEGMQRIRDNLKGYGLWRNRFRDRIIPIPGDLSRPLLDLEPGEFEALANQIDWIYHCAASLNFVYPYSGMKSINVLGTQEILRLACQSHPKVVHYMSTFGVFESPAYAGKIVTEDDSLEHWEGIFLGYAQSKWVAEKLVWEARHRGLPACIYRLPLITGHSQTGVWNTSDFTCLVLKGCTQMRSFPDLDGGFSYAPVDYVARAVAYLSRQSSSLNRNFHLNNPHPIHREQSIAWSLSAGYPLEYLSYDEWKRRLAWASRKTNNVMAPLQPFFLEEWSDERITVPEMYERKRMPIVDCQATVRALAVSQITCPPMNQKLFNTYFFYFLESGFLDAATLGQGWFLRFQLFFLLARPRQWWRAMRQGRMRFSSSMPLAIADSMGEDRPLGLNEQMMETLNRQASTYNVVTISRVKGPLTPTLMRGALDRIRQRHPRLDSRIIGPLNNLRFETWEPLTLPLRVVANAWQTVVLEELNQQIDTTQGLMRTVLVRSPAEENVTYLVTTLHHAICDGLSSMHLHADLLTLCQQLATNEPVEMEKLPSSPPLEVFLPKSSQGLTGFMNAWLFWFKLVVQRLRHRPAHLPFEGDAPIRDRRCNILFQELDEAFTQRLAKRCKQEGTSVQGAIGAAMLLATAQTIAPGSRHPVCMGFQSALDLRRRLVGTPDESHLSLFASSFMSYHTVHSQTAFWDLARQVRQALETGLQQGYFKFYPLVAKYLTEYYLNHLQQVPATTFLTNLGQVKLAHQYGPFELENIYFTASNLVFGGTFAAAISTFRGKMQINHVFPEPTLSQDTVKTLSNTMLMHLTDACQDISSKPSVQTLSVY